MFKNSLKLSCAFICTTFLFLSCNNNKTEVVKTTIQNIDTQKIVDRFTQNKENIIFEELFSENNLLYFCLSTKNKYFLFDIKNQNENTFEIKKNINVENPTLIKNKIGYFLYFEKNSILKYNYNNGELNPVASNVFDDTEFPIGSFYRKNLNIQNDTLTINYGKRTGISYIDKNALKRITKNKKQPLLDYPAYFHKNYIHYNALVELKDNDTYYYTFQTSNSLNKYNTKTKQKKEVKLDNHDEYPLFDTSRMKDMLYIYKYSNSTSQNQNIFFCNNKIIVLVQKPVENNNKTIWENYFYIYSKDLEHLNTHKIKETINIKNLCSNEDKIYFLDVKNKKLIAYEIL